MNSGLEKQQLCTNTIHNYLGYLIEYSLSPIAIVGIIDYTTNRMNAGGVLESEDTE